MNLVHSNKHLRFVNVKHTHEILGLFLIGSQYFIKSVAVILSFLQFVIISNFGFLFFYTIFDYLILIIHNFMKIFSFIIHCFLSMRMRMERKFILTNFTELKRTVIAVGGTPYPI